MKKRVFCIMGCGLNRMGGGFIGGIIREWGIIKGGLLERGGLFEKAAG